MHPRIVMLAMASIITDLVCIAAVAFLLLSNNPWIGEVGAARFLFVVVLVGIGLVPMMYLIEREATSVRLGRTPEPASRAKPGWNVARRSAHAA